MDPNVSYETVPEEFDISCSQCDERAEYREKDRTPGHRTSTYWCEEHVPEGYRGKFGLE